MLLPPARLAEDEWEVEHSPESAAGDDCHSRRKSGVSGAHTHTHTQAGTGRHTHTHTHRQAHTKETHTQTHRQTHTHISIIYKIIHLYISKIK